MRVPDSVVVVSALRVSRPRTVEISLSRSYFALVDGQVSRSRRARWSSAPCRSAASFAAPLPSPPRSDNSRPAASKLQLFAHVAQRVLAALAVELVDRHHVGVVEHLDLLELAGGAEFGRHHAATLFGAAAVPDAACRCHCRVNPCTSGSELISHFGGGTTKGVPCSVF